MDKKIQVGICGLGVVGGGVLSILTQQYELLRHRTGLSIVVSCVSSRSNRYNYDLSSVAVIDDPLVLVQRPELDIIVETIGGVDIAKIIIEQALKNKKHVVTANKALIAQYGDELSEIAQANGVVLAFEAAVAGGIPIIKTISEAFIGNEIQTISGIINATSNYILSEMHHKKIDFEHTLEQAKKLGIAEANSTLDVSGMDAAHKLTIMAKIAFDLTNTDFLNRLKIVGIDHIKVKDIRYAQQMQYTIKSIALAQKDNNQVVLTVEPMLIENNQIISQTDHLNNCIMITGDSCGPMMLHGAGAGSKPTASAIVGDVVDVACRRQDSSIKKYGDKPNNLEVVDISCSSLRYSHYLAIHVQDACGVMQSIAQIISSHSIGFKSILQHPNVLFDGCKDIIIITDEITDHTINKAIKALNRLDVVTDPIRSFRVYKNYNQEDREV